MNNDNRITGNFLEAIQKYADSHKRRIEEEAEEFKQRELKKAEDKALEEAYEIIQNQISRERTDVRIQLARREQESRRKLFLQRQKLTEKVFEKAEKSDFCQKNSFFNFDWVLKNNLNSQKVYEGNFDNRDSNQVITPFTGGKYSSYHSKQEGMQ